MHPRNRTKHPAVFHSRHLRSDNKDQNHGTQERFVLQNRFLYKFAFSMIPYFFPKRSFWGSSSFLPFLWQKNQTQATIGSSCSWSSWRPGAERRFILPREVGTRKLFAKTSWVFSIEPTQGQRFGRGAENKRELFGMFAFGRPTLGDRGANQQQAFRVLTSKLFFEACFGFLSKTRTGLFTRETIGGLLAFG